MTQKNQSYTEGLAQITTEEGQLAYGIQRYILGFIATVFWTFLPVYIFTDYKFDMTLQGQLSPAVIAITLLLAIGFTVGSWWANRLHHKLTALQSAVDNE